MKITQCYISKSISDFPFRKAYGLTEYVDSARPCIFFGCYSEDEVIAILEHKALAVIVWCGQDSLDFKYWKLFKKPNIRHVSFMKNVAAHLQNYITCTPIKYKYLGNQTEAITKGNKVYVYMPQSNPGYHGYELVKNLHSRYSIIIGDGTYTQNEWQAGKADEIYKQCFIGLVLSEYAGGGSSIVELGLRGIRCVTNVLDLPNVINWKSIEDIKTAIENEAQKINTADRLLPIEVQKRLDNNNNFLNTEFYGM